MHPFSFEKARSDAGRDRRPPLAGGRYIAGGTTLVDLMREEVERPEQPRRHQRACPCATSGVEGGELVHRRAGAHGRGRRPSRHAAAAAADRRER